MQWKGDDKSVFSVWGSRTRHFVGGHRKDDVHECITQACCMPLGIFTADVSVNLTRVDLGLRLTKGGLWPGRAPGALPGELILTVK